MKNVKIIHFIYRETVPSLQGYIWSRLVGFGLRELGDVLIRLVVGEGGTRWHAMNRKTDF
jgi:hypothetical protein